MHEQELAVTAVRPDALDWLAADSGPAERETHWRKTHGDGALAAWLAGFAPTHMYFGSEFCEHLLPSARTLRQALARAASRGLRFALLTPIASPDVLARLESLLSLLPGGAEVIVNDWGVAQLVAARFPMLTPVAGRVMCRMVKDPRLTAEWSHQCGHGLDSPALQAVLQRLRIERVEIDAPLFADADTLGRVPRLQGVHLPYFSIAKGRMCRPGSLSIDGPERFAVGRRCRKECLRLATTTSRPGADNDWQTVQVGNTIFGRQSAAMLDTLKAAVRQGFVKRLVVAGEAL